MEMRTNRASLRTRFGEPGHRRRAGRGPQPRRPPGCRRGPGPRPSSLIWPEIAEATMAASMVLNNRFHRWKWLCCAAMAVEALGPSCWRSRHRAVGALQLQQRGRLVMCSVLSSSGCSALFGFSSNPRRVCDAQDTQVSNVRFQSSFHGCNHFLNAGRHTRFCK
jgi:hypothetical protein